MDQLTFYQTTVKNLLNDYLARFDASSFKSSVKPLLIVDDQHGQYLIIRSGWRGKDRVQHILIFLRVVDGKIWIEEDWTDYDVAGHLLDAGIPQNDIVLAFHHPSMRQYSEFAVS